MCVHACSARAHTCTHTHMHGTHGTHTHPRSYAASNTRRGVESCGILAGTLSTRGDGTTLFAISSLIIPKQEGTSDTVQARGAACVT